MLILLFFFNTVIGVAVKFAREYKIARVHKISQRYLCTKTLLHEGIKLHDDTFAQINICTSRQFCTS